MTIASLLLALVVTAAADTSNGAPVLLDFHASWCGPCQNMRPEISRLTARQYPIQSVDIDQSPDLAEKYNVKAVPTFIVADAQGRVLARTQGFTPAAELAAFYNEATLKAGSATDAPVARRVAQPTDERNSDDPDTAEVTEGQAEAESLPANPKPWETVVRIKMLLSKQEWGFGSGTIIYSDEDQAIILTCAHIFRDKNQQQQSLKNFNTPIKVDLFDGKTFVTRNPATLRCVEKDLRGEAIDYDFNNDVGLIRIRPNRRLPASRVVPADWKPQRGLPMYSVGCSHGQDATAWSTRILDPMVRMNSSESNKPFYEMKCEFQPSEGRSGGGLYTQDGFVAGVCDFADPKEKVGLYATPAAIHRLLDRAKLTALYQPTDRSGPMLAAASRSQTRARMQSPSDPEPTSDRQASFTIPDPGAFHIANPETRVASNRTTPRTWPKSDPDAGSRRPAANRRPDRELGADIDPGAGTNQVLAAAAPRVADDMEPLDLPEPTSNPTSADSGTSPGTRPATKWKGVHSTRPRPRAD